MIASRIAIAATLITLLAHVVVLFVSDQSALVTPISELSRARLGWLHTIGLLSFALAHVALAAGLGRVTSGWLFQSGRALLATSGLVLFYVAYYFSTATHDVLHGPDANDPLAVLASITGFSMGALQPGLLRFSADLGRFNLACIVVWLLLIPLALLVNASWLGGYERLVGITYLAWAGGLIWACRTVTRSESDLP